MVYVYRKRYHRWTIRLIGQSQYWGQVLFRPATHGLDLNTCLACQYIVISAVEYECRESDGEG
jgi:hypothetical protein